MIPRPPRLEDLELQPVAPDRGASETVVKWRDVDRDSWKLRVAQIPRKDQETVDEVRATYVLVDKGKDQHSRLLGAYNLRDRSGPGSRTYGPEHMVFSSFGPQELDKYRLTAGILLLKDLVESAPGAEYSGFFNRVAPSHSGFHFQYVRERLPVWKALADDAQFSLLDGRVEVKGLRNWLFSASCFEAARPHDVAEIAWAAIQDDLDAHDVLLSVFGGKYRCIPVRRRQRKPISMCVTLPDHIGNFGGMELSGVMILTNGEMAATLEQESPERLQTRMLEAFREICASG